MCGCAELPSVNESCSRNPLLSTWALVYDRPANREGQHPWLEEASSPCWLNSTQRQVQTHKARAALRCESQPAIECTESACSRWQPPGVDVWHVLLGQESGSVGRLSG